MEERERKEMKERKMIFDGDTIAKLDVKRLQHLREDDHSGGLMGTQILLILIFGIESVMEV